ncbi:MAG: hypothetical protein CM15mV49_440 [uncultured marine virus]|nr:MAG: hypothetical protein CM15mV49_440 [uncultured marine virus]
MMNKELEKKEIERIIRYWQGKMKYAKMRIIENEKKTQKNYWIKIWFKVIKYDQSQASYSF